jgi:hypothetical protein
MKAYGNFSLTSFFPLAVLARAALPVFDLLLRAFLVIPAGRYDRFLAKASPERIPTLDPIWLIGWIYSSTAF